jgi:hypothetical protein
MQAANFTRVGDWQGEGEWSIREQKSSKNIA